MYEAKVKVGEMVKKTKKSYWRVTKKTLKHLGILGFSKTENIFGINPIIISTIYIILTLFLASILRKIVKIVYKNNEKFSKQLFLEFIATIELCACCYELIIIADNWGIWAYALYLFLLTIWWGSNWEEASACPYNPVEEVVEGSRDVKSALWIIGSQLLGALVTFRYVQVLWSLELVETHVDKAYEDCTTDLQVETSMGVIIEGAATCLCRVVSRILGETNAKLGNYFDAFFCTMMVVAAFNFSGGYFNPALATSLKLGCDGNTFVEHVLVYWFGATAGAVLSIFLFKATYIQDIISSLKPKIE
ncbi:aquaporin-11 [Diorhabda carinulata]|uniref:aquaporin-11 n=1 Tax=Diorhabda carinulata TaxID=1163345 RepID=UPI0025A0A7D5|nr:aquaporin-11 [Diorhabda carinulata]